VHGRLVGVNITDCKCVPLQWSLCF
jgi:hypothetical protein